MALILVIDDDHSARTAIQALLQSRGVDVLGAASGAIGIRHLETSAIDLAIVKIFMPDMDGLEIIRTLRRRTPRVPVIAMSGAASRDCRGAAAPDFLEMAGRLGAACCLRNPIRPHQLMAAIETCLGALPGEQRQDARETSIGQRIAEESRTALHVVR
jgi:CheY-like chemotaxis protein